MESFVPPVILGMGGPTSFQIDSKGHPPGRQPAQPMQGLHAGKGCPVIRSDRFRQPVSLKNPLKGLTHRLAARIVQGSQFEHLATELIADRLGFAPPSLSHSPPSLEVHGPHLVGGLPSASTAEPPSFQRPFSHSARLS